jgi:hypothetical protein
MASRHLFELNMEEWFKDLESKGYPMLVVGEVPPLGADLTKCISSPILNMDWCVPIFDYSDVEKILEPNESFFKRATEEFSSIFLLSPFDLLCANGSCPLFIGDTYLYRDDDHINMKASSELVNYFNDSIETFERAIIARE